MKKKDKIKLAIVGHVDHGKSSLIGRLIYDTKSISADRIEEMKKASIKNGHNMELAFLLDHLHEEREQGITIDTTQAIFRTQLREYIIIDAPGHVEFLKNMVTGASQAEIGILIIDAEERIQEQTKRHAFILSMLGMEQIIVLINKMDLVDYKEEIFNSISSEIKAFLKTINLTTIFIIPISATEGDNISSISEHMSWYKGVVVLDALDSLEYMERDEESSIMVMPIQDVYKLDSKRIAVGRIGIGKLCIDDDVVVLPSMQKTKIKSIEIFLKETKESIAGESIGVTTKDPVFIDRGSILCSPNHEVKVTNCFKASIFHMSRNDLRINEKVTIRCATQEVTCEIMKIDTKINSSTLERIENNPEKLGYLEVGEVYISTKRPISVDIFRNLQLLGRFVLTRDNNICASGIITGI